jgi:hypothetical protein
MGFLELEAGSSIESWLGGSTERLATRVRLRLIETISLGVRGNARAQCL